MAEENALFSTIENAEDNIAVAKMMAKMKFTQKDVLIAISKVEIPYLLNKFKSCKI